MTDVELSGNLLKLQTLPDLRDPGSRDRAMLILLENGIKLVHNQKVLMNDNLKLMKKTDRLNAEADCLARLLQERDEHDRFSGDEVEILSREEWRAHARQMTGMEGMEN